ncbi:MAG: methylglyoxal synthase [Bacilli bacterium]
MRIALVAHDRKKDDIVNFAIAYQALFSGHELFATGTTGGRIADATGLPLHRFRSGPLGGDQQIGALIAEDRLDLLIFLRDPLMAQPHEPDILALLRLCDVHDIPVATNMASAEMLLRGIWRGDLAWRELADTARTAAGSKADEEQGSSNV